MQTKLKDLWGKIKGFFTKLNKRTLILLGVCAAVVLVAVAAAALLLNRKDYAVLCTGLTASETSNVVQFLNENGVTDYQIQNNSILVPADRQTQLQAQLVTSKTLTSGFLYEYLTEHTGSLSTESERKEAVRIAMEEKLAAIIRQFEGVRDAWVTITPATERVYVMDDPTAATASVTITPDGNRQLSSGVVESIRYTVSHSVKELDIENVSIVDTYGNPYDDTTGVGAMQDASALQRQYEQQTNNKVRSQVLEVLTPVYGEDNVHVAVNTTVDMSRKVVETTEYAQPEGSVEGGGLIGSEKWFWEAGAGGDTTVGGVVGTATNSQIPNYPNITPDVDDEDTVYSAGEGERDHRINTTVTQREVLSGTITDVSVAVTVNQNSPNAGALSAQQLTDHVVKASGIGSEDPASRVSVLIAPFANETTPGGIPGGDGNIIPGLDNWIVFAALGGIALFLILLLIILLLARRSKKKKLARQLALEAEQREAEAAAEAAAILAAMPPTGGADIMEVNTEKSMELRKTVRQFAQNNPEIAAQMVRGWLKGEDTSA